MKIQIKYYGVGGNNLVTGTANYEVTRLNSIKEVENLLTAAPELLSLVKDRLSHIEKQAFITGDDPTSIDSQYDAFRTIIAKAISEV